MNIKKIIATDMDGTFLRSDHSFDKDRLERILGAFKERGYLFVAASGRPLMSLEDVFSDYKEQMAFVAENGSIVSYQGQILFEDQAIPKETYLQIIDGIDKGPFGSRKYTVLSGRLGAYMLEETDNEYFDMITKYYLKTQRVADFSEITEDIVKIVASFPGENLKDAVTWFNEDFDGVTAVTTGLDSVDIILSDMNKAVGLQKLCEHFKVAAADVIAFGDNQNDMEMLEFAGLSLATANARPEVKAVADQVIGHCDQDAVLEYIENQLL